MMDSKHTLASANISNKEDVPDNPANLDIHSNTNRYRINKMSSNSNYNNNQVGGQPAEGDLPATSLPREVATSSTKSCIRTRTADGSSSPEPVGTWRTVGESHFAPTGIPMRIFPH